MKIDQLGSLRPGVVSKPMARVVAGGSSFADVLDDERRRLEQAAYEQLLADIERQGRQLAHTRSARDLLAYKALIQRFVREVVERALTVEERHGQDRRRRPRVYKLLRVLDEKLLDLSRAVLAKETPHLEVLARIGEIHGLLVNFCL